MNKLTKVLSVFLIAGAIGTGVAGAAGCAHKHTYSNDWTTENGYHWHAANCAHSDLKKDEKKCEDTNGDGKCDVCGAAVSTTPAGDELVIKKDVDGLIVEGVTGGDVQLSKEKTSHDITKSAIKVYAAVGTTKGDEIPAANLDIKLTDPDKAELTDWTGLKKNGTYKIDIKLKNAKMEEGAAATVADLTATVSINVKNAIVANSLTLKTGTTTQAQSVTDSISATWTFEVERANGDKVAVTAKPTYTGLDTSEAGENKEATATVTVEGVECTGKVTYTITENAEQRTQSYAYNFGFDTGVGDNFGEMNGGKARYTEDTYLLDTKPADHSGTYIMVPGCAEGSLLEVGKPRTSKDGEKFFTSRYEFGGGTFVDNTGKVDTNETKKKYMIIQTESAGKITVYWSRNSSAENRGIALWSQEQWDAEGGIFVGKNSKTSSDFLTDNVYDYSKVEGGTIPIGSACIKNTTGSETNPEKAEFTIPKAGVYYLTSATSATANIYYIQIDNEYQDATKENITVQPGNKVVGSINKSHTSDATDNPYVQQFNLGDTFTVDEDYSFKATSATANTAQISEDMVDVADLEFWLGTTKIIPGTTALDAALITQTGDQTVTVKYQDAETTYKINVASALGVDSIKAKLSNDLTTEVANDSATALVKLEDIIVETVGTNENVDVTYTATYLAKDAEAGATGTEITEAGVQIGKGEYVITVSATVTDKTNSALTKGFTATVDLEITVAGNEISWIYHTKNATVGEANPGYAANSSLVDNGLLTVVNLSELKSGYTMNPSEFNTKITDGSNKPTLAAAGTMGNVAITFTNAMAFADKTVKVDIMESDGVTVKAPQAAPELLQITAKQNIKVYLYLNSSDDKHGSNKTPVQFFVKNGDGEYATTAAMTTGNRKSVQSFILELNAGDVVTIKSQLDPEGSGPADARIWFYGFEAKVVTE